MGQTARRWHHRRCRDVAEGAARDQVAPARADLTRMEAAAQLHKGLEQLALLRDDFERQRQELEFRSAQFAGRVKTLDARTAGCESQIRS
jgi:hypothetical protein